MPFLTAWEFLLVPAAFVRGAAVGDVFPFSALSGLYFLHKGPYVLLIQLRAAGSQPVVATATIAHTNLTARGSAL
jgi:hypothetical protein